MRVFSITTRDEVVALESGVNFRPKSDVVTTMILSHTTCVIILSRNTARVSYEKPLNSLNSVDMLTNITISKIIFPDFNTRSVLPISRANGI